MENQAMGNILSAADLRRWARSCAAHANNTTDPVEQQKLLRMEASFLELANTQEWLGGIVRRDTTPLHPTG
jgi:hypothetical protein